LLLHVLPYTSSSSSITTNWDYFPTVSCPTSNSSFDISPISPPPPTAFIDPEPSFHALSPQPSPSQSPVLSKSTRNSNPPVHLQDYVCNLSHTSSAVSYPISDYISYTNILPSHCVFALSISSHTEPTTYAEASKFTCWKQAMQAEITALENTGRMQMDRLKDIRQDWLLKVTIKLKDWTILTLTHQLLS